MMKILLLTNQYPKKVSYYGINVKKMVDSLKKMYPVNIEIVAITNPKKNILKYAPFIMKCFLKMIFFNYDIIYSFYCLPTGTIATLLNLRGKPHVVHCPGSDLRILMKKNKITNFLTKFTLKKADGIITVSKDLERIVKKFLKNHERIKIVYPGTNFDLFKSKNKRVCKKKLKLPLDKRIILYVGNLVKVKRIDILLKAFSRLENKDNFVVCILGNGILRKKLEEMSKKLRIDKYVNFVGGCPLKEVVEWMNSADILVLPSESEGFGNVIVEAMACGLPVIASNVGGVPEIIKNNKNGLLFNVGNINQLKNCIQRILIDEQLRKKIIKNGLLTINKFSLKKATKERYTFFKNVIAKK